MAIDSHSVGDPARFLSLDVLHQRLGELPPAPSDCGTVVLLVSRQEAGRRELPAQVLLTPAEGMPGDAWGRHTRHNPEAQLAVMQADVARLVANGQPIELAGDNLFVHFNLSTPNLPLGSRVQVGNAVLEVTPLPHNGCSKFRARFGADALRFVNEAETRWRNLRGIYLRVVEPGVVSLGDAMTVLSRAAA